MDMADYKDNSLLVCTPGKRRGDPQVVGCGKIAKGMAQARKALGTINQNIPRANQTAAVSDISIDAGNPPNPAPRPDAARLLNQISSNRIQSSLPEDEGAADSPLPEFLQHILDLIDEDDHMGVQIPVEEMQLEEDVGVWNSQHLAVVEYADDLHAFYQRAEDLSFNATDYMSGQADINDRMRAVLVNWLIEIHDHFKLMEETLFLTVNLVDRFLAIQQVQRTKLQILGATAMLLACKYVEVISPLPDHFVMMADNSFSRGEMLRLERLMANRLQFNMSTPTPYVFIKRFLEAAESDARVLAFYIIELSLVDYEMIKYRPSLLAAAAVFSAESALSGHRRWTVACQEASSYSQEQLMECAKLMVRLHQKANQRALTGRLTGVYRKFKKPRFGDTTSYEPASFLLEDNSNNNDNNVVSAE